MNVQRIGARNIGAQWVIDAGFIAAIDVWGEDVGGEVCLDGVGSLLFLDASTSPRAQSWLDSVQRDGQTCATLDRAGMLILMPAGAQYRHCRVSTTGHLKLRAEPSVRAEIIGYVPSGATLNFISRNGDWFNVEYLDKEGWLSANYVSVDCGETVDLAPEQTPAGGTASLAASPSQQCGIITTGHLKLRASPSLDGEIISYVPSGESPRLLSRNRNWLNVEYLDKEGWLSASYVSVDCGETVDLASEQAPAGGITALAASPSQQCGIITTGHLKLRASPSLDGEIIGYVPTGESPRLLSRNGNWFHVEYLDEEGWLSASYVSVDCGETVDLAPGQAPAAASAASPSQQCGIITIGHLKLRASPSLDGEIISYVPSGESPRLLSRNGNWLNVEYLDKEGWIGRHYTSDSDCGGEVALASDAAQLPGCGITTTGILRVRAGPSLDDDIIGFVQRGVMLRSISWSGDWVNVEYQGKSGWLGVAYVTASGDCD